MSNFKVSCFAILGVLVVGFPASFADEFVSIPTDDATQNNGAQGIDRAVNRFMDMELSGLRERIVESGKTVIELPDVRNEVSHKFGPFRYKEVNEVYDARIYDFLSFHRRGPVNYNVKGNNIQFEAEVVIENARYWCKHNYKKAKIGPRGTMSITVRELVLKITGSVFINEYACNITYTGLDISKSGPYEAKLTGFSPLFNPMMSNKITERLNDGTLRISLAPIANIIIDQINIEQRDCTEDVFCYLRANLPAGLRPYLETPDKRNMYGDEWIR